MINPHNRMSMNIGFILSFRTIFSTYYLYLPQLAYTNVFTFSFIPNSKMKNNVEHTNKITSTINNHNQGLFYALIQ